MRKGLLLLTILVASLVTFLAGPAALAVSRPGDVLITPARDPAALPGNKGAFGGPPGLRSYVAFESGPVRPLALSADGQYLYAANTPDNRLEIFAVHDLGLTWLRSVPVGLEPVALAVAPADDEVWVVNHLSDSVSVVDIAADVPHVKRTLWVGDEPRDIVFAGKPNKPRAFITTAHRGQNAPLDPQLDTPSVPRANVWVFKVADPGPAPGGEPITILRLFGDTPRALAVNADGTRVYAAVFLSGNRTTTLPPVTGQPFPKAPPSASADGVPQPNTGLIVQFDGTNWVDELGQTWNNRMWFSLPDLDVFEINATANPPTEIRSFASVGTVLFNMAVNPKTGAVYVSNTEALNTVRFAGAANRATTTVQGHLADHRITVINNGQVSPRDLNKHLDFDAPFGTADDRAKSLSLPMDMVVSSDGETLYLAAFGSQKVAAFDVAALEDNSFTADPDRQAQLSAGGPGGVVLDESRDRLYVLTRFDMGVSVVDTQSMTETSHVTMYNPEPASVTEGRPFLYDARLTSSRGNDSCATCHVFGNVDALAWDLGDPDGEVKDIPNAYHPLTANNPGLRRTFHPMKGPMTTQSMRGLPRHGPMHWRGDRTGTNRVGGETLEEAAFKEFNEAFVGLMAREEEISDADMQKFTDFSLQLTYPPNPIRALDNSLNSVEAFGETLYRQGVIRGDNGNLEICVTCHIINEAAGVFGTTGTMAFNNQAGEKDFKIPHFRDQYQKVGMHGWSFSSPTFKGDQIRGYSYNHNGATSTTFILDDLRLPPGQLTGLRAFLFAFPAESAPVLGQQVTLSADSVAKSSERLDLLIQQGQVSAPVPECDLVAQGLVDGSFRSWQMTRSGLFLPDDASAVLDTEEMKTLAQAPGNRVTFTCTPWGSGRRIGVDRDEDGLFDKLELAQGSNPADAESNDFVPAAGNWFNPARPGHGLDIQRVGDLLAITWYTYADDGSPTWYQTSGPILNAGGNKGVGGFVGELLRFSWDHQAGEASFETAGTLALTFADKYHVTLEWTLGTSSGSEPMEFFAFAGGDTIIDFTGMWYDGGEPGYGLSVASQGDVRAVVVFFYDAVGQPRWVLGSGDNGIESELELLSFTGFCPDCDWVQPTTVPGGSIQFAFTAQTMGLVNLNADFPGLAGSTWLREAVPMTRLTTDATNF